MDEEALSKAIQTLRWVVCSHAQHKYSFSLRCRSIFNTFSICHKQSYYIILVFNASQLHRRPSVIFHAGGIFRRCQKPMEEMVEPNIAMAEARASVQRLLWQCIVQCSVVFLCNDVFLRVSCGSLPFVIPSFSAILAQEDCQNSRSCPVPANSPKDG